MKRLIGFYTLASLFLLSACSDVYDQDFTPQIEPLNYFLFPVDRVMDSVRILQVDSSRYDTYDTISIADTVRYIVELDARTSLLTSFRLTYDTTALDMRVILTEQQLSAVEDSSDVDKGLIYFKPLYGRASLQVQYIALKAGMDTILMRVASTSKFSPNTQHFYQPVR